MSKQIKVPLKLTGPEERMLNKYKFPLNNADEDWLFTKYTQSEKRWYILHDWMGVKEWTGPAQSKNTWIGGKYVKTKKSN